MISALTGYNWQVGQTIELTETVGRLKINLLAQQVGLDWNIAIFGGDRPHIGAVALIGPGSPCSLLCMPKHREGGIAKDFASAVSNHVGSTVCATCGIHLDNITQDEIRSAEAIVKNLASELISRIQAGNARA